MHKGPRVFQQDHYENIKSRYQRANALVEQHYARFVTPPSPIKIDGHLEWGSNRTGLHMDSVWTTEQRGKLNLPNLRAFYAKMLYSGTPLADKKIHLDVKFIPDLERWVREYSMKDHTPI